MEKRRLAVFRDHLSNWIELDRSFRRAALADMREMNLAGHGSMPSELDSNQSIFLSLHLVSCLPSSLLFIRHILLPSCRKILSPTSNLCSEPCLSVIITVLAKRSRLHKDTHFIWYPITCFSTSYIYMCA